MTGLKIAFVLGTTAGGTGRHAATLASACAEAGMAVRVFGPAGTKALFGVGRAGAVPFETVTIADRPRPRRDVGAVLRLRRLLGEFGPDVAHAHGLRAGGLAALALWPARRSALVVTVHNAPPPGARLAKIYSVLERLVARRADVVLCVSPDLSARMRGLGARDVRLAVVAAPELPAGTGRRPAELVADGRPVVLGAGRLAPQKGFDTLIAAAATAGWRARRPVPLVVIAGAGPLADDLAHQARDLGVDARFLGERDDVAGLLAAADVFALPSRWEGQPLILAEALRAGRPIVAADVGGVRDLAGDQAALLVPPGDPAAFGQAVLDVLGDAELARRLSAAAADRAAELPTEADAAAAALELYRGWLSASSAR
jgi:glycosyltransferase involved in cell wall biosynthesis